ncbi:MAG: DUF1684 domain-containing protein [Chitinophagales bacterium]
MKKIILFCCVIFIFSCTSDKKEPELKPVNDQSYFTAIENHRNEIQNFFAGENSPLDDSSKLNFSSVKFFPVDTGFRVIAEFEKIIGGEVFEMPSSGQITDYYQTIGKLHFKISGKQQLLEVYENQNLKARGQTYYFVPFNDLTNGLETYGGGRYLDLEQITDKLILDFNMAYQPYCAYNHSYSCPIPPAANKLDLAVRAGERNE